MCSDPVAANSSSARPPEHHRSARSGICENFGIPNFRVATVTTTAERIEQMIEAKKEIAGGRG